MRLLILDEPTAALNDIDSAHLLDLLRRLRDRGHHLHHDLAQAERDHQRSPTRTTVIRDGRTVETHGHERAGDVTQDRIIRGMVGRDLDSFYPDRVSAPGEEVLRIEDWTVWHPVQDRKVVDGAACPCAPARSSASPG